MLSPTFVVFFACGMIVRFVQGDNMNIPTDEIVMTVALIAGLIYFKTLKEASKPKEIQSDEEE